MIRRLRISSYYIRIHNTVYYGEQINAFFIVSRSLSDLRKHASIRYLSASDLASASLNESYSFLDIFNIYYASYKALMKTKTSYVLFGESGSEVDPIVSAMYLHGPYSSSPMVQIHCRALDEDGIRFL